MLTLARLPQLPHFDSGVARASGKGAVVGGPGACPDDTRMRLHHPAHQLEWLPACRPNPRLFRQLKGHLLLELFILTFHCC